MKAYKFYLRDAVKGFELVGILPERRRNPERVTSKSVMNWGRRYFGTKAKDKDVDIRFVAGVVDERGKGNFDSINHPNDPKEIS